MQQLVRGNMRSHFRTEIISITLWRSSMKNCENQNIMSSSSRCPNNVVSCFGKWSQDVWKTFTKLLIMFTVSPMNILPSKIYHRNSYIICGIFFQGQSLPILSRSAQNPTQAYSTRFTHGKVIPCVWGTVMVLCVSAGYWCSL